MKKSIALILSLALAISMTGCGKAAAKTLSTTAAPTPIPTAAPTPTPTPVFVRDQSQAKLTVLEGKGDTDPIIGGVDVPVGRYVITVEAPIASTVIGYIGSVLAMSESMCIAGISPSNITADIVEEENICVAGGSTITFTPVDTVVTTKLTSGSWIAGIDIPAGKYICKVASEEQSMSVTVYSAILTDKAGPFQIGGNYSEPELALALEEGQVIFIDQAGTLICTPE